MGFAAAVTAALGLWIILWALGQKGFDAFLVAILIMVVAIAVKMLTVYAPKPRSRG
jgi:hypothetical protein